MSGPWRVHLTRSAALTAAGFGQVLLAVPAVVLGVLTVVAVPLAAVGVGFALAWLTVPLTARLAGVQRRIAGWVLDEPVRVRYADTAGAGPFRRPLIWARDGARWRDLGWLFVTQSLGMALSLLPVVAIGTPITHLSLALTLGGVWWILLPSVGLPLAALWWMFTPQVARVRALLDRSLLGSQVSELQERVARVTESRAEAVDLSAAEIRRIERDLHDGAQARIAALGMTIGLAEQLLRTDPDATAKLLREARETTVAALEDLRSVVRGVRPPVLADRGLAGAVEALALSIPIPVTVSWNVPDELPPPVESATYFAVAECIANTAKHAQAQRAWVSAAFTDATLRVVVGDDGVGGADPAGSGLAGIARRIGAFDGTVKIDSPDGGPTVVTMELRC